MRYLHRMCHDSSAYPQIKSLVWRPPEVLDRGSAEWVDNTLAFTPRIFDLHPTLERFERPIFDEKCPEGLRARYVVLARGPGDDISVVESPREYDPERWRRI